MANRKRTILSLIVGFIGAMLGLYGVVRLRQLQEQGRQQKLCKKSFDRDSR